MKTSPIKPIPFKVMKSPDHALLVQIDEGEAFYPHLHYHPEYQVTAIVRGDGVLYAGNSMGLFREGDVLLIGSDVPHLFKSAKRPGNPGIYGVSLFFDRMSFGKLFFDLTEMERVKDLLDESNRVMKVPGRVDSELYKAITRSPKLENEHLLINFLQILSQFCDSQREYLNSAQYRRKLNQNEGGRLNEVLAYTFEHFREEIKIEQIAKVACLSRSQFSYFFKLHTGKTFVQFVNELRVENACLLLRNEGKGIEMIGLESGFNNVSHFIRQFKKIKQMSPSAYQKSWRID